MRESMKGESPGYPAGSLRPKAKGTTAVMWVSGPYKWMGRPSSSPVMRMFFKPSW